jgi:mono/diheme cytochrome c family protein
MPKHDRVLLSLALFLALMLTVSCNPNPQPEGLTPVPTLAPAEPVTLIPALEEPPEAQPSPVAESGEAEEAAPAAPAGDPANGAEVFALNCAVCHGTNAEGGAVGPTLTSAEMKAKEDDHYRQVLLNGIAGTAMAAFQGRITDQEIEDVIAFLRSLQ